MQIIYDTDKIKSNNQTAIAIGKFDGIHRGHQELIRQITDQKKNGFKCVIFTFSPAPEVYFGLSDGRVLLTGEEKISIFEQMGIDILINFPMTRQTAAIPAESFLKDILTGSLNMKYICAGEDLTFGDGGKGNSRLLLELSKKYDYKTEIIPKITYHGREISSSYIKEEVIKGNMPTAAELLGHNYRITGTVVHGNHLGRTLGMPTVNLLPEPDKILPPCGVYYSITTAGPTRHFSITNIGYKPTVSDRHILGAETYLYGFDRDLYSQKIQVELLEHKRPEIKFSGVEMLKAQTQRDIKDGKAYFQLDSLPVDDYN